MEQKFTVLFDLDGTLVDTAPDLIRAHNHVMKKFGHPSKSIDELRNAVGRGAKAMMAKGNGKWNWFDEKVQNEITAIILSERLKRTRNASLSEFVRKLNKEYDARLK